MKLIGWMRKMNYNNKQCNAKTKFGKRCKRPAIFGGFCCIHQEKYEIKNKNENKEN